MSYAGYTGQSNGPTPGKGDGPALLVLFLASLFTASLASQRFFHALFLARFQVKGVSLDLLDNVFLLHLALETAQSVLEGLTLLNSYFGHLVLHPQTSPIWTR